MLSACGPMGEAALYRPHTYAFPVPPEVTFDLEAGQPVPDEQLAQRLNNVRLLFLGEFHNQERSHAFQEKIIRELIKSGRKVTIGLEMFPPQSNKALDAWRKGKISEVDFLDQSEWYTNWGFPFAHYRPLFKMIQEIKLPAYGINASKETRKAVRESVKNKGLKDLSPEIQKEIGDLEASLKPHTLQLQDALNATGHGGLMKPGSDRFESFRRVQWLWERLMGSRAAKLAEEKEKAHGPKSIVVVLIGSGHLRNGLGANLQAARTSPLPLHTVVDEMVTPSKTKNPVYPVAIGTGNWVRVYEDSPKPKAYPALVGLKLEKADQGVKIISISIFRKKMWKDLKKDDLITQLNNTPITQPTQLRLLYENLPLDTTAKLHITRENKKITLEIKTQAPEF